MVKKSIKTILLSSGACLLASLLTFGLHEENASVASATSFNEIETTAFCHIAGIEASTDVHFVINLTEANFGEATRLPYSTYESKISALDFASHIYLNGCPMSFDSFNDEGFKFSSDDNLRFNVHEPGTGTFSIRINFAAGKTYDNISTVTIDKGCLFPSLDYMNNTSTDVYSIASNLSANRGEANWGWVTYMDTEVYKISTTANTYLGLSLTISDYPTGQSGQFEAGSVGNAFTNYRNHITLNENVEMAASNYGLFCYADVPNSVWVQTTANTSLCTEVTISEGLIISSYHKVKANPWWPLFFKITNTHTFTKSDVTGEWPPIPVYEETEIEEVNLSSINAGWLSFRLTNSDYSTFEQNSFNKSSYYNLWDKISLIDNEGVSHKPREIAATYAHIFNFNNAHVNEIAINLTGDYGLNAGSIKKVVIPAGTEFPEYKYIKGTNTGKPKCYITTEEKVFLYVQKDKPYATVEKTTVTGMGYNVNGYLHFILSNNDYPEEGETTGGSEHVLSDFKTKIDLTNIGLEYTEHTNYCLWSYTPYADSIAPAVDGTLTAGYVTIPKGTLFPSYNYSSDSSTDPLVYETSEDALFYYDGTTFESLYDNTIKSVGYRYVKGPDICIYFRFTINDWPNASVIADMDIHSEIDYSKFLNKIEIIDVNDVAHGPSTEEVFVNVWGTGIEEASFGFRTNLSLTDIKTVVVHEGCAFPTYDRYNDAEKDYWYKFHETKFYSSKDYSFYLGTNLTANEYASEFNSAFSAVCSGYDGYSSNKLALENKFYAFKNIYDSELTGEVKAQLNAGSSDAAVLSMIQTYSYVVAKYALTDFLDLGINVSGNNTLIKTIINNSNVSEIIIIVSIAAVAIIAVGGYFFFNKKKEDK